MSERQGDPKVQLGCGTLIVIALIVMIFSGGRESAQMKRRIDQLNEKIDRLEKKIDDLSKKLEVGAGDRTAPVSVRPSSGATTDDRRVSRE